MTERAGPGSSPPAGDAPSPSPVLLSPSDLAAFARAQRVLLSPLEHASTQAWAEAASDALCALFHADRAVVTIGGPGAETVVADGVGRQDIQAYGDAFAERDRAGGLVLALPRPYYVEEDFAGDPAFADHVASDVYNEWYRPLGLTRALGMLVLGDRSWSPGLYERVDVPVVANVLLAGSPMSSGPGAERARALLPLLQPALSASVATLQHLDRVALQTGAALDVAGVVAWLYGETGPPLFESRAASRSRPAVRDAAGGLARGLFGSLATGRPATPARAVTSGSQRLLLCASALEQGGRRAPCVLVVAKADEAADIGSLRQRFGLTLRQAEVARLLALRRTNDEIAEALFISPHTARRHTEAVLRQLKVPARWDVAAALSE